MTICTKFLFYKLPETSKSNQIVLFTAEPIIPAFIKPLESQKVTVGEPLKLEAKVTGFPVPEVHWFKDGAPLYSSPSVNLYNKPEGLVGFTIDEVQPENAGVYTMTIMNPFGDIAGEAKIEVVPKAQSPEFVAGLDKMEVVEGFPLKMQVQIVGYPPPDIKWMKNGSEIKPQQGKVTLIKNPDNTQCLIIQEASPEDSGCYEVVASNELGVASSKAELGVIPSTDTTIPEEAPKFISALRDVNANEGEDLTISAPFIGNPIPEVIWTKDGEPITPNERQIVTCDRKNVGLLISPAQPEDSGVYECLLANPLGEAASKCLGNVRKVYKKPIFSQKLFEQKEGLGNDAKLSVKVSGVPHPEVQWFFNDKPIYSSDKHKFKNDGDHHMLTVRNCAPSDAGLYKCHARNREGEDTTQGNLGIVERTERHPRAEPPNFLKRIGDLEGFEGMKGKFTACVTGYPEPEIDWFKDDVKLFPSEKYNMESNDNGLIRLIVNHMNENDVGHYTCKAYNPSGEDSCTADLFYECKYCVCSSCNYLLILLSPQQWNHATRRLSVNSTMVLTSISLMELPWR